MCNMQMGLYCLNFFKGVCVYIYIYICANRFERNTAITQNVNAIIYLRFQPSILRLACHRAHAQLHTDDA